MEVVPRDPDVNCSGGHVKAKLRMIPHILRRINSTSIEVLFWGNKDLAFRSPCSVRHADSEGFWDFAAGDNSASCSSLGLAHERIHVLIVASSRVIVGSELINLILHLCGKLYHKLSSAVVNCIVFNLP